MRKTREILRQKWCLGRSHREVARSLGKSLGAISATLARATKAGLDWEAVSALSDEALDARLYGAPAGGDPGRVLPDFAAVHAEHKRPGVTLELLHLEYLEQHPGGYLYTQFCEYYRRWLARAGFQEEQTLEGFDWDAPVTFDRDRVRDLFTLGFVERREDAIFLGPVGVGKTFLASALGHAACRAGYDVLFLRADHMLHGLHQARADHSTEKALRRLLAPDVLILDDFGLRRLDARQSSEFYEVVLERHRRASTIVTSNRAIDEWIPLFDDPVLAQSALDRLAHNAYQLVIEGDSYRKRQRPGEGRAASTSPSPRTPRRTRRIA
jgi:DNA replication protein DnaC